MTKRDKLVRLMIAIGALATVATSAPADHELRGGNNLEFSLPDTPRAVVTINREALAGANSVYVEFFVSGATRHTTVPDDPSIFVDTYQGQTFVGLSEYCLGRQTCEVGFSIDAEGAGVGTITAVATVLRDGFDDDFSSDARIEVAFDPQ